MPDLKTKFNSLISLNLSADTEEALSNIGLLIDISFDLQKKEGLERGIKLLEEIQRRNIAPAQHSLSEYFFANAWSYLRILNRKDGQYWDWEEGIEQEIIHLRKASHEMGFRDLPDTRKCEILTNTGNLLNHIGRFVDALEYWDRALDKIPSFAMARGNRGYGLLHYAKALYDKGHAGIFFQEAYTDLQNALAFPLHNAAKQGFKMALNDIETHVPGDILQNETDWNSFSLGDSEEEISYRQWCLKNRLFLNPLNDLGYYTIAARDVFSLPSITVKAGEGPYYHGFFDQMKQEFVSARYLFYEGSFSKASHFSDKEVLLFNTLDYPSYSLSVERIKAGFKIAYAILDKISFFMNDYFHFGIPERQVSFRTLWYNNSTKKNGLRNEFKKYENWSLRGLFWLSKDLFEDKSGFRNSIDPDAQKLSEIRNHLEHKYLKLHENSLHQNNRPFEDTLAYSLTRSDFELKTLRLFKIVRAALIYLSLAIHSEEVRRNKNVPSEEIMPINLAAYDDKWKT